LVTVEAPVSLEVVLAGHSVSVEPGAQLGVGATVAVGEAVGDRLGVGDGVGVGEGVGVAEGTAVAVGGGGVNTIGVWVGVGGGSMVYEVDARVLGNGSSVIECTACAVTTWPPGWDVAAGGVSTLVTLQELLEAKGVTSNGVWSLSQ
jgi:hypothetical protein